MGIVDFDPEKWSRAHASEPAADVAKVARVAKLGRDLTELSQLSQLSQVAPLPADVRDGVAILRQMKAPRGLPADRWKRVVTDAVSTVGLGWAGKALATGWTPLHLFGAVISREGDPYSDGLVVWLGGRTIVALLDGCFAVQDGDGRAYFSRREQVGARLLWELGK